MSIVRDFEWYYNNQYIGLTTPHGVAAFHIDEIEYEGEDSESYEDGDESNILFIGWYKDIDTGVTESCQRYFGDTDLILKLPRMGHVSIKSHGNGRVMSFLSYTPLRSVKKGWCTGRVRGADAGIIDHKAITEIFKKGYEASPKCPFRIDENNSIIYKFNTVVGVYQGDKQYTLTPGATYLSHQLEEALNDENNPTGVRS
jgi:hypothetical protein